MKKSYLLVAIGITSIAFIGMQKSGVEKIEKYFSKNVHVKHAAGALAGKTGAPGEVSCVECHAGSTQDGTVQHTFNVLEGLAPITNYVPGNTYNVSLQLATHDVKEGFEAIVLDVQNNAMAGSFTGNNGIGTQIVSAGSKDYATHTSASNSSTNQFWVWEWTAPATNVGPVKFYVASNKADGNGATGGDLIYLSQHTLGVNTSSITENVQDDFNFTSGYSPEANRVFLTFNSLTVGEMYFNLVDLTGKSVFTYDLGESMIGENDEQITLPSDIETGIYLVHFFVGNKAMSSQIMVK